MTTELTLNKNNTIINRIDWVDQLKGFTIFLVVYGHNFPFCEKYIYSFHMPLFIMIAGFFHPRTSAFAAVKKRFQSIVIPYFMWSSLLFVFWFFLGRKYGDSATLNLSPVKNFIGIFYAQGNRSYMDWGIPLWFLTALFCTFLLFSLILQFKYKSLVYAFLIGCPLAGFAYSRFTAVNLP